MPHLGSWSGQLPLEFALTWLHESTGGALAGQLGELLLSDLAPRVTIRQASAPDGFHHYQIELDDEFDSRTLRQLLVDSPYSGRLLEDFYHNLRQTLPAALSSRLAYLLAQGVDWPPSRLRIPLHLPYLDRHGVRAWTSGEGEWSLSTDATGRVLSQPADLYQAALLLAGAVRTALSPHPDFDIRFNHRAQFGIEDARYRLAPMLVAYGFPTNWLFEQTPPHPFEVTWSVGIPGQATAAWIGLPPERSLDFFESLSSASISLQQALRHWTSYLILDSPERFSNPDLVHCLLAYSVMRPFRSNKLKQYVADVLDPMALSKGLKAVKRRMATQLSATQKYLKTIGLPDLARRYSHRLTTAILNDMGRMPRYFAGLVACESHLLDEMLSLAAQGRDWARHLHDHPDQPVRALWRDGGNLHQTIQLRLRRGWSTGILSSLVSLVLLEATRGLAQGRGFSVPLDVCLVIDGFEPGERWIAVRKVDQLLPRGTNPAKTTDDDPLE
jgi:hypothetical protein